jgi:hypothetical protein
LARADLLKLVKSSAANRLAPPPAPTPPSERPRTLEEARVQNPALAGQKLRQPGGVSRRGQVAFDVKISPFSTYDAALIRAVEQRWFSLLESSTFLQRSGKVVVEFTLHSDGRIDGMREVENEVGEILGWLCQRAISDPAPYGEWPSDMRRMIGATTREVTFTFFYN